MISPADISTYIELIISIIICRLGEAERSCLRLVIRTMIAHPDTYTGTFAQSEERKLLELYSKRL